MLITLISFDSNAFDLKSFFSALVFGSYDNDLTEMRTLSRKRQTIATLHSTFLVLRDFIDEKIKFTKIKFTCTYNITTYNSQKSIVIHL